MADVYVHRIGLTELTSHEGTGGERRSVNIIFVHGLGGHPRTTWEDDALIEGKSDESERAQGKPGKRNVIRLGFLGRYTKKDKEREAPSGAEKTFWPRDFLAEDIPEARIYTYGYNADAYAGIFKPSNKLGIHGHARDLAIKIDREIDNEDPIVFVAHSLGGIIVKDTIHRSESCLSRTEFIIFLGTPHRGSDAASWGNIAANLTSLALQDKNQKILSSLEVDSDALDNINEHFVNQLSKSGIKIHSFYEARPVLGIKGLNAKIVDDFSSKLGLDRAIEKLESIDADHRQMVRCKDKKDIQYRAISGAIRKYLRSRSQNDGKADRLLSESTDKSSLNHEKIRNVTMSLSFREIFDRRHNVKRPHHNTCEWILENEQYRNWLAGERGILWIKGKPGAGKSTIMTYLYDGLISRNGLPQPNPLEHKVVDFFFHARGAELQKTPAGMFRSLAYQLLQNFTVNTFDNFPARLARIFLTKDETHGSHITWQNQEVENIFEDALFLVAQSQKIMLFIDALDEAGNEEAYRLGQFFDRLNDRIVRENTPVKILISCRHFPAPTEGSGFKVCVEEHNQQDIETYVSDTLRAVLKEPKWQEVIEAISERSSGIFQWACLVVRMVVKSIPQGKSPTQTKQRLQAMPKGLEEVYEYIIMVSLEPEDMARSLFLFQWLCFAYSPLQLNELRYILAANDLSLEGPSKSCREAANFIEDDEQFMSQLNTLSGGLAEIVWYAKGRPVVEKSERSYPVVQLIHQSVRDFLTTDGLRILANLSQTSHNPDILTSAHFSLFRACLNLLSAEIDLRSPRSSRDEISARVPFYHYINYYAFTHAKDSVGTNLNGFKRCCQSIINLSPLFSVQVLSMHYDLTPMHLAAMADSPDLIENLAMLDIDIDGKDSHGYTALHLAIAKHSKHAFDALLKRNANVNAITKKKNTPLSLALRHWRGDGYMTIKLIKSNADVNAKESYGRSPLQIAAGRGNIEIVQLLLDNGAQIDARCDVHGSVHGNALQVAAISGDTKMVQLLLSRGANVNAQAGEYGNALQAAAGSREDNSEIIRLLLDKGADINAQGGRCGSALQAAAAYSKDNPEIVRLLLDKGADVNAQGGRFGCALQAAAWYGSINKVQLLLSRGADVNARGSQGSPLYGAVEGEKIKIVQLLFKNGADLNICDPKGTALEYAIKYRDKEMIELLQRHTSMSQQRLVE